MPHEFTQEQLDQRVLASLEARRRSRQQAEMGGAAGEHLLTEKLRAAMARRRETRGNLDGRMRPLG